MSAAGVVVAVRKDGSVDWVAGSETLLELAGGALAPPWTDYFATRFRASTTIPGVIASGRTIGSGEPFG